MQDCDDVNPLIRALAVRTMGCIRVDKITEYLCEPLRNCLKDQDPYVRKTAAVCVSKLYDIEPSLVEDQVCVSWFQYSIVVPSTFVFCLSSLASHDFALNRDSSSRCKSSCLMPTPWWWPMLLLRCLRSTTSTPAPDSLISTPPLSPSC